MPDFDPDSNPNHFILLTRKCFAVADDIPPVAAFHNIKLRIAYVSKCEQN